MEMMADITSQEIPHQDYASLRVSSILEKLPTGNRLPSNEQHTSPT